MLEGDTPRALEDTELDSLQRRIDDWADRQLASNDTVAAVERGEAGERRWYVRLRGEAKDVFTVWFTLRQRTLLYETYVLPAPEENHAELYEYLLRRNRSLFGACFAIGEEDAVFLVGQHAADEVDDAELDRILGSMYAWVEAHFTTLLRIGFASRIAARSG